MNTRKKIFLSISTFKPDPELLSSPSEVPADFCYFPNHSQDFISTYKRLDKIFHRDSVPFKRQVLISEIAHKISLQLAWDLSKSFKTVIEISNLFHMNYIELTYWQVLLRSLNGSVFTPLLTAYITAYQAKLDLNTEVSCYEYLMNLKIPNFRILFYNWQLVKECEPSAKEINLEFELLVKRQRKTVDYESLVDGLMDSKEKVVKKEEISDIKEEEMLKAFEYLKGVVLSPIDLM